MAIATVCTVTEIRRWVDAVTTNWDNRTPADVDAIVDAIRTDPNRPRYGVDWSPYFESLPENLLNMIPA